MHISPTGPQSIVQLLAIIVAVLGASMVIWVSTAFVRQGKGTPIPSEPPTRLVITRLYRYVRNPMYLGAIVIVCAEAVYFGSAGLLLYAAALWTALQIALLVFEEPQLKRRFGPDYEQYLAEVPRWIPTLRSRYTAR